MARLFTGVMAVALIAGVAGCASGSPGSSSVSASSSPSSPAVAAANYWPTVNAMNAKLTAGIARIRSARTPDAVGSAVMAAEATVYLDYYRLAGTTPPASAQDAQHALVIALRDFRGDLTSTGTAADGSRVCAGSAALEMLGSTAGARELRSAEAGLASVNPTAAARTGSVVPSSAGYTHRRLANGTLVRRPLRTGPGQLTIHNGNDQDAVVSLVRGSGPAAALTLYVRAKSSATTTSVADGTYQVYYTTGSDWDPAQRLFTRFCDFEKLNKGISFSTTQGSGVTDYTTEQITLSTVFAGNVTASKVPADKFPAS